MLSPYCPFKIWWNNPHGCKCGGARYDTLAQSHVLEGRSSCKVSINEHNHEMDDMQNMNKVIWLGNDDDDMQLDK